MGAGHARNVLADLADAGLRVTADGDRLVIRPASKLTDRMRAALRASKAELLALLRGADPVADPLDLSAVAWTEADIARFLDRRARLLRWGWAEQDAENLAERLGKGDRDNDDRVSCIDCEHYRPGRCGNHGRAGLHDTHVGRDLASLPQRCLGFDERKGLT